MANYTFDDAITLVKAYVKNPPTTAIQTIGCDQAHSIIWRAYPWDWTLGSLTTIALVDGTQDYSISDADFWRLTEARITRTDVTPNRFNELNVLDHLPPELNIKTGFNNFRSIARDAQSGKLRLESAASVPSGVTLQIDGKYQKIPTKITSTATSLVSPDYYFQVFVDWLTYFFYKFTDDSRAGGVAVSRATGERTYSGQMAVAMAGLSEMMVSEDAKNGNGYMFPTDPIGSSLMGRIISVFGPQ